MVKQHPVAFHKSVDQSSMVEDPKPNLPKTATFTFALSVGHWPSLPNIVPITIIIMAATAEPILGKWLKHSKFPKLIHVARSHQERGEPPFLNQRTKCWTRPPPKRAEGVKDALTLNFFLPVKWKMSLNGNFSCPRKRSVSYPVTFVH